MINDLYDLEVEIDQKIQDAKHHLDVHGLHSEILNYEMGVGLEYQDLKHYKDGTKLFEVIALSPRLYEVIVITDQEEIDVPSLFEFEIRKDYKLYSLGGTGGKP